MATHIVGNRKAVVLKQQGDWIQLVVMNSCWKGLVHVINEVINDRSMRSDVWQMSIDEVIEIYKPDEKTILELRQLQIK